MAVIVSFSGHRPRPVKRAPSRPPQRSIRERILDAAIGALVTAIVSAFVGAAWSQAAMTERDYWDRWVQGDIAKAGAGDPGFGVLVPMPDETFKTIPYIPYDGGHR